MNVEIEKDKNIRDFLELYTSSVITFNIRFFHHISKISGNLNDIRMLLLEPDQECEELTLKREKKLAAEFSRRFTRNYLYSIQLKLNKFENEIVIFASNRCCKISKAFLLRTAVLSLFRYLSNSVMVFLSFLKKSKIKPTVKLKELLNYVSQAYEICKYVVDHKTFEIHDIISMCSSIYEVIQNQKCSNSRPVRVINSDEVKVRKKMSTTKPCGPKSNRRNVSCCIDSKETIPPASSKLQQDVLPDILNLVQCKLSTKPIKRSENISCVHVVSELPESDNIGCGDVCKINGIECCRTRIYEHSLLLCDALLNQLISEVCDEISECIEQITTDTYNREFTNHR